MGESSLKRRVSYCWRQLLGGSPTQAADPQPVTVLVVYHSASLTIVGAMLLNQMIVVSGGGGFSASASTGPTSPGIDDKEL